MSKHRFVVPVADIEEGPKEVSFALPEAWLRDVLEPEGASARGAGTLVVELTKQGSEVMVRGHAAFGATLPCVVTLDPVDFDLRPEIFLLLKPGKAAPPVDKRGPGQAVAKTSPKAEPEARARRGRRRPTERDDASDDESFEKGGAPDTYVGEEIVLDDFVREFLILELPLYPRRPDLPSPEESLGSRPLAGPTGEKTIDPRLEPLAKLAARLRGEANKE